MPQSTERILTSHTGSLHRPGDFEAAAIRHFGEQGGDWDTELRDGVAGVVAHQRELGIDIVNDGEYSKTNWLGYVEERLGGFGEPKLPEAIAKGLGGAADVARFPQFYADAAEMDGVTLWQRHSESFFHNIATPMACVGEVSYTGGALLARDVDNLLSGLAAAGLQPADGFIGVAAPGTVGLLHVDEHYADREAFFFALADAIGEECRAITDAGLSVQLDDPMLPSITDMLELDRAQTLELGELIVAASNRALKGIAPEQVRYHICWGSWNAPHAADLALEEIIDLVYTVDAQTYSIEAANARHEHEWRVFEKAPLPDGKRLMPGVVAHATNVVEHPQVVADRIERFARIVGRENVIAGSDCGFRARCHPEVAWAKLRALSEGAALATRALWG